MADYTLTWKGAAVLAKVRAGAVRGLTEVDLRGEAAIKAELYPGHGKLTGALQRGVTGEPAQAVRPTLVRGRIAVKGIPYARRINRRYRYMEQGYATVRPRITGIVTDAIRREVGDG